MSDSWIQITGNTWRLVVPGGWLYRHYESGVNERTVAMVFVPAPEGAALEAERDALAAEMERQAGLWNEQHAHQHALLGKLEAENAKLKDKLSVAVEALKILDSGLGHHQYQCSDISRAALETIAALEEKL